MRAAWSILREWYDAEFAAYLDGIVKDAADRPNASQPAQWKAAASTEVVSKIKKAA